jgi:hypothetical protein
MPAPRPLPPPPRISRKRASPEERALLTMHKADHDYAKDRYRLALLLGRAVNVRVEERHREATRFINRSRQVGNIPHLHCQEIRFGKFRT